MNIERVSERINEFIASHRGTLGQLPAIQTQVLELAAAVAASEHYESFGYTVEFHNPRRSREFVVKCSSRGHPWNYSWILAKREGQGFEIHMNLSVRSARDSGIYCVDIGVTEPGIVPRRKQAWACLPNNNLVTFAEVKKLVVYPMLLAHFIGIVHELAPAFLTPVSAAFEAACHFPPALLTLGRCTPNSREIVAAYPTRGISVIIEAGFDDRFSDGLTKFRFGQRDSVDSKVAVA